MNQEENINQPKNPRSKAGIFSIAFFWWMNPLLGEGYKKDLEIEDIYQTLHDDESDYLGDRLKIEWEKELEKQKICKEKGKVYKPSLFKALLRNFGPFYAFLGLFTFIEEAVLRIYQPLFMGWMMEYFVPNSGVTKFEAYMYALGVVGMSALYTFTHHPYFFGVMRTGMRIRIASCALIYRKALKLSNSAMGKTTVGQMVNLLSNDVNRFDQTVLFFHYLWAGPLQLAIITVLLWQKIGPSSLVGTILLIAFVPIQTFVGRKFGELRVQTAAKTDKRIRLMNEIVNGIKVIKMYTWEQSFTDMVEEARKKEIGVIRHTSYYRAFNFSFFFTASRFIFLCTCLVYGLTGEILTSEKAFLALSMYNTVRLSMTLFFPFAISMFGEAKVSVNRIQAFLMLEERDNQDNCRTFLPSQQKVALSLAGVTGKWSKEETENTLSDITLNIKPGELVAVIGPVGSGKSSLIQSILGELPLSGGSIDIYGDISYAPQESWVFAGSVKDNILFGKPFVQQTYRRVIQACALEHDLQQWPHGDRTLVGEKGVSLSGGQKARVTLARAVYRSADCYLLDDPLSAVDAHVGKHLFQKCIRSYLQRSAVILVTHQLQYLKDADLIVVLHQGRIQEMGTFNHLVNNGLDFSAFLSPEKAEDGPEDEDDEIPEEDIALLQRRASARSESRNNMLDVAILQGKKRGRARTLSIASVASCTSDISQVSGLRVDFSNKTLEEPTQVKETKKVGSVDSTLYVKYFLSGGGWFAFTFMVMINLACQAFFSASDWWITYWTKREELVLQNAQTQSIPGSIPSPVAESNNITQFSPDEDGEGGITLNDEHYFNLGVYAAIVGGLVITSMIRTIYFFVLCMRSSVNLHNSMFMRIVRTPSRFFDVNPVGRILNRFSKDIGSMDELLPPAYFDALTIFLNIVGILAVIFAVRPLVILPTLVLAIIFLILRKFYMRSARDIKRLEGVVRSPVFSHLSTSLQGLTSIRAFQAQNMLSCEFDRLQDVHTSAWFAFISGTRWFGVWLDWIVVIYLACVVFSFLVLGEDVDGGDVGLAISSCITLTGMLQWGVRQSAEVENLMTSVERVMEYSNLEEEAAVSIPEQDPPDTWPSQGVVEFKDLQLRYADTEPYVLKGLNFKTRPSEKIGIVGRTGAGKSSLITALFRLAEPAGSIYIDGVDVTKIGLRALRSKISIIPQDPLLFTGTLRRNLDPFDEFEDETVWRVLKEVHLSGAVADLKLGIETEMSEGGSNFSVGQRQLVCLARAVLRHNSILIMDEATANVDPRTDQLIQEQIRTRFRDCTVLTIAHRLHTIMDSDRILVLADGRVVEYDSPYALLCKEGGVLAELAAQAGEDSRQKFLEIARSASIRSSSDTADVDET